MCDTYSGFCCDECLQILVEGEVRMSGQSFQELVESLLPLVEELLTLLVKVPTQLFAR